MVTDEYTPLREFISGFLDITEEEWQLHRDALSRRFLKKGEFLLRAGQVSDHVSFINEGFFRTYTIVNDQERTNYFFFEHEYVTDYASFLTRQPSNENIQALEDAEVLQLNFANMQILYEKIPAWQKYGRLISEHVFIIAVERSKELLLNTPEELYLKIMKERPQILSRVPQHYIASYLGIQPESLSRIRKRLMVETKKT